MNTQYREQSNKNQHQPKPVIKPIAGGKEGRAKKFLLLAPLLLAMGLVACAPPAVAGPAQTNTAGAKIQFPTPVHDFGKIKGGEIVSYTYIFTNIGDRLLEVSNVQASCGCTTAGEWSRQVEPGKTGSIPIQFNSGNFRGDVTKMITVTCNDAAQPAVTLQLRAQIWAPIEVAPQFAILNVTTESPSNATTVHIVNNEEIPLTLSAPESNNRAFAAELRTNQPGKDFQLIIKTVPPLPAGNVQGQITLKTSSTNMTVINVTAWVNMQQAPRIIPPQVILQHPIQAAPTGQVIVPGAPPAATRQK